MYKIVKGYDGDPHSWLSVVRIPREAKWKCGQMSHFLSVQPNARLGSLDSLLFPLFDSDVACLPKVWERKGETRTIRSQTCEADGGRKWKGQSGNTSKCDEEDICGGSDSRSWFK